MKVVVTGASGQLGHDVVAVAQSANHDVVGLSHDQLDITDAERLRVQLEVERPDAVINCAAYTDVDGAEDSREQAFAVNAEGAANLACVTDDLGARVVYVSTDYVFDGCKRTPYTESDAVGPTSAYGESKLAGELETANHNQRHFIVRTSWLFGVHGDNFVNRMLYLAQDSGEVVVVNDQTGCPTYTGHLAGALVGLLDSSAFGVHHIAGWGECSWYEFAVEIFKQADVECRVLAGTTEMLDRKARRPAYSSLISEREHPSRLAKWQTGLTDFLSAKRQLQTTGHSL